MTARDELVALEDRVADVLAYYQCRESNPKADHPRMGYHAFSDDQREFLKNRKREAAAEIVRMMIPPQTVTEPDEDLVEAVGIILREHQPTTGMSVASGVTCRCGYWNGQEVAGVTRPPGYNALMWHHVQLIAAVTPSRAEVLETWAKNLSLYDEMGDPDPAWVAGIESARRAALDEAAHLRENEVKS